MRPATIEFDFAGGRAVYREGLRQVEIPLEMGEHWRLDPARIGWWTQGGGREPVSAAERDAIVDRVVLAARTEHRIAIEVAAPAGPGGFDPAVVLGWIDEALARISPLARQDWELALSIERQLLWCQGTLRGEPVEPAPGPLTMGWRATREFDHFGNDPAFAALINRIEDVMRSYAPPDDEQP